MAKAVLLCGKIASGKSVYAERYLLNHCAVLLSVDEITIGVLGGDLGQKHDEIAERTQAYLFDKSLQILRAGTDVLLDWGFWTRERRAAARAFYESRGIVCEFHYLDTPERTWRRNIAARNQAVLDGHVQAYFVDDGLLHKLNAAFEPPAREEIDVWLVNAWDEPAP